VAAPFPEVQPGTQEEHFN